MVKNVLCGLLISFSSLLHAGKQEKISKKKHEQPVKSLLGVTLKPGMTANDFRKAYAFVHGVATKTVCICFQKKCQKKGYTIEVPSAASLKDIKITAESEAVVFIGKNICKTLKKS